MVFNLSIQCDNIADLRESLRELINEPRFESNGVGDLPNGKTFDYSFADTDDVFYMLHGDVKVIKPE